VLGADVLKCWVLGCWVLMGSGALVEAQTPALDRQDTGRGMIAGVVRDVTTGLPAEGVTVAMTFRAPEPAQPARPALDPPRFAPAPLLATTLRTDSKGRFVFSALRAGSYTLRIRQDGYAPVRGAAVTLASGQVVTDVALVIGKHGSISGTVRDDAGDPVVGVSVRTFNRPMVGFRPGLFPGRTGTTDDRGHFRIADLPPGDYLACACARDPLPIDKDLLDRMTTFSVPVTGVARELNDTVLTFAPTFHTGSTRVSDAVPITVGYADDRTGVDITLRPESPRRVSGQLTGGGTNSGAAYSLLLFPQDDDPAAVGISEVAPVELTPEGTFHFAAVTPGKYTLEAFAKDGTLGLSASVSVIVGDHDVTDVSVALNAGATVKGRVNFSGTAARPEGDQWQKASVGLVPIQLTPAMLIRTGTSGGIGFNGKPNPDGAFTISGVKPGRYLVTAGGMGAGWHAVEALVDVPADGLETMVVTMSDVPAASLEATVALGRYELGNELRIAMFPMDQTYWSETFAAPRRFALSGLLVNGTATFPSVPAGEYYVALVDTNAGLSPERMTEWAKSAVVVRLRPGEMTRVAVRR